MAKKTTKKEKMIFEDSVDARFTTYGESIQNLKRPGDNFEQNVEEQAQKVKKSKKK